MSPYVRTVKTSSGATAVQIVYSSRRGSREIGHLGSAHDDAEVELLKAAARQQLAAGQGELELGLRPDADGGGGPLPITSSRMGHLWDALACGYAVLGLERAAGGDEVFRDLVLARIIEPSSKLDSARVLEEAGVAAASYPAVCRRLRVYARDSWRAKLSAACVARAGLGPASLVLYDVSTLYFETDAGDGSREPGFTEERRLEPQITIGLLTGQDGFPLMIHAFEGNKAETTTIVPAIQAHAAAHQLAEKSFRMSKHDLQARPIYHRKRDSIEAHLTIVFAALAISHWIETTTGWSIRKFIRTARRYRTITIQAGAHTITAADPVPDDLQEALTKIGNASRGAH